jgi:hypothetical protein
MDDPGLLGDEFQRLGFGEAAYADIQAEARRLLRCRLAELVRDPEGMAHHLARSTAGADASVAAALDAAAHNARRSASPIYGSAPCVVRLRRREAES